ncbi:MAG TPA: alkaline phosphatase family protein [Gemmatimonadales bacterium]|nr:alkaline phosphatase family protein [Gemmatimonadales bacterium]
MANSRKLLLLGLDAASPPLLEAWAADGTLPNIAKLMATGLVGETRNNDGFEGSTWPSFFTGLNPAGHGFYWQQQRRPGTYREQECVPADFDRSQPLWEIVSAAGHRVVVLDVPLSKPSTGLNGVQTVEWGGHDRVYGFHTSPRGLRKTVLRSVGSYPIPGRCDTEQRSVPEYRQFADQLIEAVRLGARNASELLAGEPWDFAIQVFGESHCAGHQLWHFHDTGHPNFDAAITQATGNLVREVYVALDTAVGKVVSGVESDTTVVLLTLHGMSITWGANFLLPEILERLGVVNRGSLMAPAGPGSEGRAARLRRAYRRLPVGIRGPLYDLRQQLNERWLRRGSPMNVDPRRSKCFDVKIGTTYGGIQLNLRGREPDGTLAPGPEAERFVEQLSRDLLDIAHPETGQRLVRSVIRTAELFQGPQLDRLPDLLVGWDPEFRLGTAVAGNGGGAVVRAWSSKMGLVEGTNVYCRTGDHQLGGMFIARGTGITPGRLGRVVSNLDLAPTFARVMGCEMPGVDGRLIPELLGTAVVQG